MEAIIPLHRFSFIIHEFWIWIGHLQQCRPNISRWFVPLGGYRPSIGTQSKWSNGWNFMDSLCKDWRQSKSCLLAALLGLSRLLAAPPAPSAPARTTPLFSLAQAQGRSATARECAEQAQEHCSRLRGWAARWVELRPEHRLRAEHEFGAAHQSNTSSAGQPAVRPKLEAVGARRCIRRSSGCSGPSWRHPQSLVFLVLRSMKIQILFLGLPSLQPRPHSCMGIQPAMHTTISRFHGSIWQHSVRFRREKASGFFFWLDFIRRGWGRDRNTIVWCLSPVRKTANTAEHFH
jgi:hypothetical protein